MKRSYLPDAGESPKGASFRKSRGCASLYNHWLHLDAGRALAEDCSSFEQAPHEASGRVSRAMLSTLRANQADIERGSLSLAYIWGILILRKSFQGASRKNKSLAKQRWLSFA